MRNRKLDQIEAERRHVWLLQTAMPTYVKCMRTKHCSLKTASVWIKSTVSVRVQKRARGETQEARENWSEAGVCSTHVGTREEHGLLGSWALGPCLASSCSEEPDSGCGRKERVRAKELVSTTRRLVVRVPASPHKWLPEVRVRLFLSDLMPFMKCPLIISDWHGRF